MIVGVSGSRHGASASQETWLINQLMYDWRPDGRIYRVVYGGNFYAGELRSIKLGTRRLISEDALTEFIAELEAER